MDDSLIAVMGEGTPRYFHSFFVSWQLFAEPDFGADVRGLEEGTHPAQRELGKHSSFQQEQQGETNKGS